MSSAALRALEELELIVQNVSNTESTRIDSGAAQKPYVSISHDDPRRASRTFSFARKSNVSESTPSNRISADIEIRKRRKLLPEVASDGVSALEALERMVAECS
jgi:hypothetical protein